MKKKIFITAIILLLIPTIAFAAGKTIQAILAPHIQIVSEGKNVDTSENAPILYNGRTYVPLRAVGEALGYDVQWNSKNARVDLMEPKANSGIMKKDGLEVVDYIATPNAMITFGSVSVSYSGEIIYKITQSLNTEATATFQVINKDNQIVGYETIIFKETQPGTYKQEFYVSYFNAPYNGKDGNVAYFEEKANADYSYRLKLN